MAGTKAISDAASGKKYSEILIWVVVILLCLSAWSVSIVQGLDASTRALIVVIITVLTGILLLHLVSKPLTINESLSSIQLGSWVVVGLLVTTCLGSYFYLSNLDGRGVLVTVAEPAPQLVLLISCFMLVIGYRLCPKGFRSVLNNLSVRGSGARNIHIGPKAVFFLVAVGLLAVVSQIAIGTFGYYADPSSQLTTTSSSNQILSTLAGWINLACLTCGWLVGKDSNLRSKSILVLVLLLSVAIGFASGGREPALLPISFALLGYAVVKESVKKIFIPAIFLLLLFVLITPIVSNYRQQIIETGSRNGELGVFQSIQNASSSGFDGNSDSAVSPIETFTGRFDRARDVEVIIKTHSESLPFRDWLEVPFGVISGMVPRSLWQDKPIYAPGREMSIIYYGIDSKIFTSSAITPPGELWRHGAWPVTIIGMAFVGFLLRTLVSPIGRRTPLGSFFLPALVVIELVKGEQGYVGLVLGSVISVASAFFAWLLVTSVSKQKVLQPKSEKITKGLGQ